MSLDDSVVVENNSLKYFIFQYFYYYYYLLYFYIIYSFIPVINKNFDLCNFDMAYR